jgi:hypothetical protein
MSIIVVLIETLIEEFSLGLRIEKNRFQCLLFIQNFFPTSAKKKDIVLEPIATVVLSLLISGGEHAIQSVVRRYVDTVKYCVDKHIEGDSMVLVGIQVFIVTHPQVDASK